MQHIRHGQGASPREVNWPANRGAQVMKRAFFALVAVTLVVASTGCCGWKSCGGGCGPLFGGCGGFLGCKPFGGCGSACGSGCGCDTGSFKSDGPMAVPVPVPDQAAARHGRFRQVGYSGEGAGEVQHEGVGDCDCQSGCSRCRGGRQARRPFQPGPPTAQVTYPYYTTRGPRDYLERNPRSIGR